jgi:putative FmdB family regulatory protein
MPMYEYECKSHGVFEALRSIREAASPEACPDCGESARRILSAAHGCEVSRGERIARDRNERSSHEPKLVRGSGGSAYPKPGAAPALQASHSSRPWCLEHG